ncbi:MAG TPA: cohesin domain-containing protein [Candidatus Krumholzibacteria bacterium]|nr:cohesin domain-containing protein [Candidatus Krumholzibacteria bacterium]
MITRRSITTAQLGLCLFTGLCLLTGLCLFAAPALAQRLAFDPSVSVPMAVDFSVDLTLDTQGAVVQGVDVVFTYEPTIVQFNGVVDGDWFTTSGLDHFLWLDPGSALGVVHISSALLGAGRTGSGVLAELEFTALAAGISPLQFQTWLVRDDANAPLVATHSIGDFIIIQEAIANEDRSWSDIKRLWR